MPNAGKPTALKLLEGEAVTVPPVPPGRPPEPVWKEIADERVRSRARAEYERLVELLDQLGALASLDGMTIYAAAVAFASWRVALLDGNESTARSWMRLQIQLAAKLGLSPADRLRMVWPVAVSETSSVLDGPHNMPTWGR